MLIKQLKLSANDSLRNTYTWRRAPVADGIELHIREDSPAAREDAVIAMREAVRAALGREDIR